VHRLQPVRSYNEFAVFATHVQTVTPLQGKNAGLEVMVQGKQIKAVVELLLSKGVPKRWIQA
jgi:translation initiation factor 1 (eIF-1/SUI1)